MKTPKAIYVGQTKDTGALAFTEDFKKAQQFEWVNTYVPMSEHTSAVDELTRQNKILQEALNQNLVRKLRTYLAIYDGDKELSNMISKINEALKSCGGGDGV